MMAHNREEGGRGARVPSACRRSSAPRSRLAAPAAASPSTATSSSTSSSAASTPRRRPGARRRERARLEGVRDGGRPRSCGQLHHRLLDREHRSHGRAYRRQHHRRARADADRQRIPDHARRLDRRAARDRRRDRRLERAVRGQSRRRAPGRHRDEPARLALLRAGFEGDGFSDRQGRGPPRRRLYAGRARERHHGRRDAGLLRADDRLRRHQDPALRLREVSRRRSDADHGHEVGGRGNGDRPHLCGEPAEGSALHGNGSHGPRRCRLRRARHRRRQERPARRDLAPDAGSHSPRRPGAEIGARPRAGLRILQVRSVVHCPPAGNRRSGSSRESARTAGDARAAACAQGRGLLRRAARKARRQDRRRGARAAPAP